ncbi:MAG: cytochrome P450 [Ketobacteraceae bacterium]|nr:cytochrome P450 [Ketobacteraceae bacterium]
MTFVPKENRELPQIPGSWGMPVFGNTFSYMKDSVAWSHKNYEMYGPVFKVNAFFLKGAVALGPEALQFVLQDKEGNFSTALGWAPFFHKLFPSSLPMRDGDDHRFNRRIVQEAFKKEAMTGYVDVINPVVDRQLQEWKSQETFLFYPQIKALALNVSAAVFMGLDLGEEADKANKALLDLVAAVGAVFHREVPFLKFRKGMNGRRYLCELLMPFIEDKKKVAPKDLFGHLCHAKTEEGDAFSHQEIVDHTIAIMFASHDTTTSILTSMAYWMARYPEWQDKVREECLGLGKPFIHYDDLDDMQVMEWVFKEGLRLNPPVDLAQRRAVRDCELLGYHIPKDTIVMAGIGFTHRMKDYWKEPERFDPTRFAPGREEDKQHPFLWSPFGGGAHKCIGMHFAYMNVKAIMHQLLTRYRFELPCDPEVKFQAIPVKPRNNLPFRVVPL